MNVSLFDELLHQAVIADSRSGVREADLFKLLQLVCGERNVEAPNWVEFHQHLKRHDVTKRQECGTTVLEGFRWHPEGGLCAPNTYRTYPLLPSQQPRRSGYRRIAPVTPLGDTACSSPFADEHGSSRNDSPACSPAADTSPVIPLNRKQLMTAKSIGEPYGLSGRAVGKILDEHGLREFREEHGVKNPKEQVPTERAIREGYAIAVVEKEHFTVCLWCRDAVRLLIEEHHSKLSEPELWARRVQMELRKEKRLRRDGRLDDAERIRARAYDNVPKAYRDEVRSMVGNPTKRRHKW